LPRREGVCCWSKCEHILVGINFNNDLFINFLRQRTKIILFRCSNFWFILINYLCWFDLNWKWNWIGNAWAWKIILKTCCACTRWESTRQHHFIIIFILAHYLGIFNSFSYSHHWLSIPKGKIENRKERKKEKKKIWMELRKKERLYFLDFILFI
jgi:hypothetical protein